MDEYFYKNVYWCILYGLIFFIFELIGGFFYVDMFEFRNILS